MGSAQPSHLAGLLVPLLNQCATAPPAAALTAEHRRKTPQAPKVWICTVISQWIFVNPQGLQCLVSWWLRASEVDQVCLLGGKKLLNAGQELLIWDIQFIC